MNGFEKDGPQAVKVASAVGSLSFEELRGKVGGRSGDRNRFSFVGRTSKGKAEVQNDQPATKLGFVANEQVLRFEVSMDETKVMQERKGPERFCGKGGKDLRTFALNRGHEVLPIDVFHGKAWQRRLGVEIEFVDFDQVWVLKSGEGGELAAEGFGFFGCGGCELFEGEGAAGAQPVLDEPDAAGPTLGKKAQLPVAVSIAPHRGNDTARTAGRGAPVSG